MAMSALLTRAMCERAWNVVLAAVETAAGDGVINKHAGTIVVLDPTMAYAPSVRISSVALFMEHVTAAHPEWHKYRDFAQAKAMLSWRTGRSSRDVQQNAPHLYLEPQNTGDQGDVKWGGSVVRDGLIVAFSGVQPEYDEWIADTMAGLLIAMCRREMTKSDGLMEAGNDFVTGEAQRIPSILR